MNLAASGRTWEDASSPAALRLTRQYEQAWQEAERAGLRCDPAEFLADSPMAHEIAGAQLAILRADLSLRWDAGDRVGARWYLDRFKDLGEEASVALIYEEFCLREEDGDEPDPAEFLTRFAGLAEPLRRVLDIHRLIGSASSTGSPISSVCLSPTTAGASSQVFFPDAGQTIGGFYLVEELGRGAFARVFLANERQLADRPVALKVTRRGSREPQALARLQHTHIVPVHSHRVDPATGLHLLCMPYLGRVTLARVLAEVRQEGVTLTGAALVQAIDRLIEADEPHAQAQSTCRAALRGRSFPRAIAWWGARLAEALEHAHDRGVLHRDIKPSNVLILGDGMPMLLDFNLARESVFEGNGTGAGAQPRGEPTLGGTVDYMAPEHLEALAEGISNRVDGRADLFGLGVLLFEALVGKKPFQAPRKGLSVVDSLLRAAQSRRLDKAAFAPPEVEVPAPLEAVIRLCLEPEPEKRYQSATEVAADLRAVADDLPLVYAREPLFSRLSRQVRRNRRRLVAAAALLVASTALLGAYVVFQLDRYERYNEVRSLSEAGTAAMDRGDFKEAQIYFDQAIQHANRSELATVKNLVKWKAFVGFGGKVRKKIALLWTPPGLEELERGVQFKAKLSDKIATTRGQAQALLDRSENLRFRLIGLGEDLPGAVGELKDLLEPFFVLTSKEEWKKLSFFWEQLDETQRIELRHEVNELLFLWMVKIETAIRESADSAARSGHPAGAVNHRATLDQALDVCDRALAFAETTGPWNALRALLEAEKPAGDPSAAPAGEPGGHAYPDHELLDEPLHVADRTSPSECFQWGLLNSSLGRRRHAIEWLQRAAWLDWSNYWYQFYLAYLEDQAELFEEALGHYNVAVAMQPKSPWVRFSRARLYRTKGMWSSALDDFREARKLMGDRPEAFRVALELGYLHQALGDFSAARREYKTIVKESPKNDYTRAARLNLANIDAESGRVDQARAEYELLLSENPQDQTTRFSRALLYLRRGEIKQAKADLDVILRSEPLVAKRHEILATRAVAGLLERRTKEAAADAALAQRLKPCPPYQRLWQRTMLADRQYDKLQLDRPEEISLLPVGGAWLASDLRAAARELPLIARGSRPEAARALLNQAVVLAALGDRQAAARVADQVLGRAELSPRAHLICARVFHHVGDRARALREIELGQALQPDEPGLLELRGVLRFEADDAAEAVVDLNRAIAGSPRNFTFLHKAAALVALGNHEGAIHEWTMALRNDPELPFAFLGRARCYVSLGLWDQALADLEQASTWAHDDPGLQLRILSAYARCVVERPEQRERFALLLERTLRQGWDLLSRTSIVPGFFR